MATSTRIRGKGILFKIGEVDYFADCMEVKIEPEKKEGDNLTFGDLQAGTGQAWKIKGKAIQSTDTKSFWSWIWEHSGETLDFIYAPHGNAQADANKPHFKGKTTVGARPAIGGGVNTDYTFEFEWDVLEDIEKVTQ